MLKYGHDLKEKLCDRGPQWGLHDLCTACFKKNTAMGEMSAEDHARAVRSTLAACSGQCDPLTILRATQYAIHQPFLHLVAYVGIFYCIVFIEDQCHD